MQLQIINKEVACNVWNLISSTGASAIAEEQANFALVLYLQAAERYLPHLLEDGLRAAVDESVDNFAILQPLRAEQVHYVLGMSTLLLSC